MSTGEISSRNGCDAAIHFEIHAGTSTPRRLDVGAILRKIIQALVLLVRASLASRPGARRHIKEFRKLATRALAAPRQTARWLDLLASEAVRPLLHCNPRLIRKIYWPYLSDTLQCRQRLDVLVAHYRCVADNGLAAVMREAHAAPLLLGMFCGKSGLPYEFRLSALHPLRDTEGELTLELRRDGAVICSVTFVFLEHEGRPAVAVGGLQGPPRSVDGLTYIRAATRDLYGLRPKKLLIRCVQRIGDKLECTAVVLVGNCNRVVHSSIARGHVHADYDELWRELGAQRGEDGNFLLSCAIPPARIDDLPSKKRSEARKRAATLEYALLAVTQGLARLRAQAAPMWRPLKKTETAERKIAGCA